jgi:hypothetical protein
LSKTFTAQTVQCSRPAAAAGIWNIIRKSKKIRTSQPSLSRASLSAVQIHPERYFGRPYNFLLFCVWMCVFCRCCFVFLGLIFSPLWYSCFISNRFQKLSDDV